MATKKQTGLVGMYFHTFKDGKIINQGHIEADAGGGHYLVLFYDWFTGSPNTLELRSVADMREGFWRFYVDAEEWREAGERFSKISYATSAEENED